MLRCPLHPGGGCGFARHGTYERKVPAGTRIVRYYCPRSRATFSLLPDCLASHLSGTLDDLEQTVATAERSATLTEAAQQLRPELADVRHALRWLRRRLRPVYAALTALVTLTPSLAGVEPSVLAVREALGVEQALVTTRELLSERLQAVCHPVGLRPRAVAGSYREEPIQQKVGPDPPLVAG